MDVQVGHKKFARLSCPTSLMSVDTALSPSWSKRWSNLACRLSNGWDGSLQPALAAQRTCSGGMAPHGSNQNSLPPAATKPHPQQMAAIKVRAMLKPVHPPQLVLQMTIQQVLLLSKAAVAAVQQLQRATHQLQQPCPHSLLRQCWNATTASTAHFWKVHLCSRCAALNIITVV